MTEPNIQHKSRNDAYDEMIIKENGIGKVKKRNDVRDYERRRPISFKHCTKHTTDTKKFETHRHAPSFVVSRPPKSMTKAHAMPFSGLAIGR